MQKMKHSPVENQVNIWINELNGYFLIIHHDIAEILLKLMLNTNQSINQFFIITCTVYNSWYNI